MQKQMSSLKGKVSRLIRAADATHHPKSGLGAGLRRLARRMELRSFSLTPEHFTLAEGARAALAIAVPLLLVVGTGHRELGWSVFAAFWTCLCDAAAPNRLRRRLLASFVALGFVNAFLGAWLASFGTSVGMTAGPVLVFLSIFLPFRIAQTGLLSTLLAVVAVVAVGFPQPLDKAIVQASGFLAGSAWAWLLINVFWRIDPWLPLRQASVAVLARLSDMAADLVATGDKVHRDTDWHPEHAEHRRTVRIALERLRSLLTRYRGEPPERLAPYQILQDAAETAFSALIALDHIFITRQAPVEERVAAARAVLNAYVAWQMVLADKGQHEALLARQIARLKKTRAQLSNDAVRGCLLGTELALSAAIHSISAGEILSSPLSVSPSPAKPGWKPVFRQALRQSAGVVAVYYVALIFQLGYPYWATMAVVVVMQGAARITWTRSIERICGSLLGGMVALALLHLTTTPAILLAIAIPLAGITISLRSVNYTVFVVFLSMLFIIVTEALQPGVGIASARILDNTIGSLAALLSVLVLWPNLGPPLKVLLKKGLDANRDYIDAVETRQDLSTIADTRRAAGLTSIEAELALHDLGGIQRRLHGLSNEDAAALKELRRLAGEAATAWHRHLALGERHLAAWDREADSDARRI